MFNKQQALDIASKLLRRGIGWTGKSSADRISAQLAEDLPPVVSQDTYLGTLRFYCPGRLPLYRANTLLTKEPETLEWIESFDKDDVLWDIGANVGIFSLYASLRGNRVLAFEPAPGNYYLLSRNIEINDSDEKISAYCIAFSDSTRLEAFYMQSTDLGGALNNLGEATDWQGEEFDHSFKQAAVGYTIDDFMDNFAPSCPNHLKIDVDGIENKILKGGKRVLSDDRVKSVLVELDTGRTETYAEAMQVLSQAGLQLAEKKHAPEFDGSKYSSLYNHIFARP